MVLKREIRVISVLLTLFMLFMLWPGASFAAAPTILTFTANPQKKAALSLDTSEIAAFVFCHKYVW